MRTTNNETRLSMRRCMQFFIFLFLLFGAINQVSAQAPYITLTSGSTCYGQSANLIIVNATATSWTVSPYVAGGVTNVSATGATINCIAYGTFTLYVTYINGPVSQPTGTLTLQTVINPLINPTVTVTPSATTACVGTTITYTPVAGGFSTTYSTKWFVDGVSQTTTYNGAPFVTSSLSVGSRIVRCELSPSNSCSSPQMVAANTTTTITGAPAVSPNVAICTGAGTTLTATGGTSYTWSPATGLNTTTGASVIASPTTNTTYTVTFGNCATPKQVTVTVNPISALTGSPCAPPSGTAGGSFAGTVIRNRTPVVLTGSNFSTTTVNSFAATDLVGFVYKASTGAWTQVPIQVDEKKMVHGGTIYNTATTRDGSGSTWGTNRYYSTYNSLQYCDANTWVGTDGTATFDTDDEVVFMARDAGGDLAPNSASYPAGVIATAGAQVKLTDPNNASTPPSYVYIFKKNTTTGLQQSAGKSYVNYAFKFKVGATTYDATQYKNNYAFFQHLETSTVSTPYYKIGFSDRWIEDDVKVTIANSLGVDLIDRHRNQFDDGCENEDSFSACEGAFIINKTGPIRGIRSHMGACSGPLTQREFYFYDQFEVIKTDLRVHQLPGMMDFWDYNPAAGTMRYSNNNNTTGGTTDPVTGQTGIPVDGSPETITAGPLTWQMMSSASGTIFRHYKLTTNIIPMALTSYYLDTNTPSSTANTPTFQCPGGDGKAWGSSGMFINQNATYPSPSPYYVLPMTDPRNPDLTYTNSNGTFNYTYNGTLFQNAQLIETNLFLPPATSRTQASSFVNVIVPLTPVVTKWPTTGLMAMSVAEKGEVTDNENVVNFYPNPSKGVVNIEASTTDYAKILVVFYNPNGKEIYRTEGIKNIKQVVDLHAPAGNGMLYIAKVHIGNKVYTRKLMVTK
ncbi:MAG: T9SS type A sorting domain-containing protein [Sphingobacteriales bacterium]|nr:MAG: T9SS type A sorting domain-containing protein [Sphingobacteriales bacterium]